MKGKKLSKIAIVYMEQIRKTDLFTLMNLIISFPENDKGRY
jgi:hypothetical protein